MTFFTPSATSEMHKYVDASLENVTELLINPEYRLAYGRADRCEAQLRLIGRLFVPNIEHGTVKLPVGIELTEMIPIVAAFIGTTLRYGNGVRPTPSQTEEQERILGAAVRHGNHGGQDIAFHLRDKTTALSVATTVGEPMHNVWPIGRPLIILGRSVSSRLSSPNTIVHEIDHVEDLIIDPLSHLEKPQRQRSRLRTELKAYHEDARATSVLGQMGYTFDDAQFGRPQHIHDVRGYTRLFSTSEAVEITRDVVNFRRSDPYYPDMTIPQLLSPYGIDILQ